MHLRDSHCVVFESNVVVCGCRSPDRGLCSACHREERPAQGAGSCKARRWPCETCTEGRRFDLPSGQRRRCNWSLLQSQRLALRFCTESRALGDAIGRTAAAAAPSERRSLTAPRAKVGHRARKLRAERARHGRSGKRGIFDRGNVLFGLGELVVVADRRGSFGGCVNLLFTRVAAVVAVRRRTGGSLGLGAELQQKIVQLLKVELTGLDHLPRQLLYSLATILLLGRSAGRCLENTGDVDRERRRIAQPANGHAVGRCWWSFVALWHLACGCRAEKQMWDFRLYEQQWLALIAEVDGLLSDMALWGARLSASHSQCRAETASRLVDWSRGDAPRAAQYSSLCLFCFT